MSQSQSKSPLLIPEFYDYCAVYLSHRCHLSCDYCITEHNHTDFLSTPISREKITPEGWAAGLNRIKLPEGVPFTFQGGEPFLYKGLTQIIDDLEIDADILTALPPHVNADTFAKMKHPEKLKRNAPYPNIRVSYHPGQNDIDNLIPRVKEIQEVVSIGIYIVAHPDHEAMVDEVRKKCEDAGVFFKTKEFLGYHNDKLYGEYLYSDAAVGKVTRDLVHCRNSVLIIDTSGLVFKCHSDLYHRRFDLTLGNIFDDQLTSIDPLYHPCNYYGLCSECDVKIKTNHHQVFGYTSVDIKFEGEEVPSASESLSRA